jgi:regulator of sirC expression with transglutaminase-like and TPR domain
MVWRLRGQVRRKLGDMAGATADFRRFLELASNAPNAPLVRQTLAELEAGH